MSGAERAELPPAGAVGDELGRDRRGQRERDERVGGAGEAPARGNRGGVHDGLLFANRLTVFANYSYHR